MSESALLPDEEVLFEVAAITTAARACIGSGSRARVRTVDLSRGPPAARAAQDELPGATRGAGRPDRARRADRPGPDARKRSASPPGHAVCAGATLAGEGTARR